MVVYGGCWWKLGRIRVGNFEGVSRLKRSLERVCMCVRTDGEVRMGWNGMIWDEKFVLYL